MSAPPASAILDGQAVRPLADLRLTDADEVGGKAANLGELLALGVHVPDGVVLTPTGASLAPAERNARLAGALDGLGKGPFAVRSSAIGEDGEVRSYAGMFETVVDITRNGLPAAVDRVLASAAASRVSAYAGPGDARMAVIVQRMVPAVAAGVALTADPISGDRGVEVVTAVRGLGERLVSGEAAGDEWVVRDGQATSRRVLENAIDRDQAAAVAGEAARIAKARGRPQDIEWAIDADGQLWIVQARPMTALPPATSWDPPFPGGYSRSYRFGEWISEPVTPLFETWLLSTMEERFHERLGEVIGQRFPRPYHVTVHGWYFYSMNWASPGGMARSLPSMLARGLRSPRVLAGVMPATVRHAVPLIEREWRDEVQPRYRAAVTRAAERVESIPIADLPALIDELAVLAGEYFASVAALTGAAYKSELNLAAFHRRHLRDALGWSHLPLVSGFDIQLVADKPAIVSLDWWFETSQLGPEAAAPAVARRRIVAEREAAEGAALEALASSPGRLQTFRRLLEDAQRLITIRDEQTRELTIAWPVLRRAVLRIGEALVEAGGIDEADDVFFLSRAEATARLADRGSLARVDVAERRRVREEQARLAPPLVVGQLPRMAERMWQGFNRQVGGVESSRALVSGAPASAGRATGPVRVIRGPSEFGLFQAGEVLVAPITAPAWTPLFARAAAVVTDVGSAASHASLVAREYGIPAVVGTVDATARLRTGLQVTVDGSTGSVEPA